MKKVRLITLYGECNFGNKLQNYALQEIIKRKGFECISLKLRDIIHYTINLRSI